MRPCPSRLLRPPHPSLARPSADPTAGFVLPLAMSACLVALLGSLSVQSAVLQNHWLQTGRQGLRQQEDALISAAQELVGRLNRLQPCLLALPLEHWGRPESGCPVPLPLESLMEGQEERGRWRLLAWQPSSSPEASAATATALLEWLPATGLRAPRRGSFSVLLAGAPLQAQTLRLVALRGPER